MDTMPEPIASVLTPLYRQLGQALDARDYPAFISVHTAITEVLVDELAAESETAHDVVGDEQLDYPF